MVDVELTKAQCEVIISAVEDILHTALIMTECSIFELLALDADVISPVLTLNAAKAISAPCVIKYRAEIQTASLFQPTLFN